MADQHGGQRPPLYGSPLTWVEVQAEGGRYGLGLKGYYLQTEIMEAYRATLIGQEGWQDRVTLTRYACHLCGSAWSEKTGCAIQCNANTFRQRT